MPASSINDIIRVLKAAGTGPNRWLARCPVPPHADDHLLSFRWAPRSGQIDFRCLQRCHEIDVIDALDDLGLWSGARPARRAPRRSAIAAFAKPNHKVAA